MSSFLSTLFFLLSIVGSVSASSARELRNLDVAVSFHSDLSQNTLTEVERVSVTQTCLAASFDKAQTYFESNWEMDQALYVSDEKENLDFHASTSTGLGAQAECSICCDPCLVKFHVTVSTECSICCDPCLPSFQELHDKAFHQPHYKESLTLTATTASDLALLATHRAWEEYFCACMGENHVGVTKCGIEINHESISKY